jgi:hypothetical protein
MDDAPDRNARRKIIAHAVIVTLVALLAFGAIVGTTSPDGSPARPIIYDSWVCAQLANACRWAGSCPVPPPCERLPAP